MRTVGKGVVLACLAVLATTAQAEAWVSLGRASGEGGGTSLSVGGKGAGNWGFGVGFVFNSDYSDANVLDYPVPHTNYTNLGVKRTGNTIGLDGYYFFSSSNIRPYVGLGIYSSERKEIARSNVTGWYYNQGDKSKVQGAGEIGLQAETQNGLVFGAGYHSIRGGNISLGWKF